MVRMGRAPFSELTCAIDVGPIVEGDMVAARWTARGRYADWPSTGSAPTGWR
jgi:hypothetical protein